jgi:hypothetical protein
VSRTLGGVSIFMVIAVLSLLDVLRSLGCRHHSH